MPQSLGGLKLISSRETFGSCGFRANVFQVSRRAAESQSSDSRQMFRIFPDVLHLSGNFAGKNVFDKHHKSRTLSNLKN